MSNTNLKTFRWKGKNQFGESLKGRIIASNSAIATSLLQQQGILSAHVYLVYPFSFFSTNKKTLRYEVNHMLKQLSLLLSAHISLVQAFKVMESYYQSVNIQLGQVLQDCRLYFQSGNTLSQAFTRHPQYFTDFFCRWIEAGEYSGTLDILLEHWVLYQEKNEHLRQKIKKSLTYPLFILTIAIIVGLILLIGVMPIFEKLFQEMDSELPSLTKAVINLGVFVKNFGLPLSLFLSLILGILWHHRIRFPALMLFCDKTLLTMPVIGKIMQEIAMARFSRTLSILISAGFPLSEALQWVSKVMHNRFLTQIIQKCQRAVTSGTALSEAIAHSTFFSGLLKQMIIVGEASGTLDKTLLHAAIFYEKKVECTLDKITDLIEPLMMVILGGMAGIFILAMYLPIFKLGSLF